MDTAVFSVTSRHLSTIESIVLEGVLQGQKYGEIAAESGYSSEYLKNNVGPKLWKLLSIALGEKVGKKNLVAVLTRRSQIVEAASKHSSLLQEQFASPANSSNFQVTRPLPEIAIESPRKLALPDSAFYIKRPPIEEACCRKLEESGTLIRIEAPNQMGKTSLMLFCVAHARRLGYRTVTLSLQRADRATLTNLDKFLRWFCTAVSHQLGFSEHPTGENWNELYGSKSNCTNYFEKWILSSDDLPLILALDQVDEIFSQPTIADDFFSLLRSWYEEANYGSSNSKLWQRLRLLIVHSTEIYVPLEINRSPFNVGLTVNLRPFTKEQVSDLALLHRVEFPESQLDDLMKLLGGHPYMVRLALFYLSQRTVDWEEFVDTVATDAGIYANHLHKYLEYLKAYPELARAYQHVVKTDDLVELDQTSAFKLNSMGLVNLRGNAVTNSCELYRYYFKSQLENF
ncbi:MAG: AAA-like domain-containing protein [Cyanobacteria bacterium J06626_18]